MRRVVVAALFALIACSPALAQSVEVKIAQGTLSGGTEDQIASFKNIPFAAPPIGKLRWRAPQPAPVWGDSRVAREFGPICPQNRHPSLFMPNLPQSEDCLTLNVWTPDARPGAKLPVMVWIFGGGFLNGGAAMPLYDGTDLAKHGVVLVTINYRLGLLGFFAHPAVLGEHKDEASGNFGLLDQIAALKWVQQNIAAFGGDASNVTIFGESAGGMSVNDLVASPMARGLFVKAISESGLGLQTIPTLDVAQKSSEDFAAKLGVTGSDDAALDKLRKVKIEDILYREGDLKTEGHVAPFIDGKVIPQDVSLLFAKGDIAKVDYISGSNSNEASLAPSLGTDLVKMPSQTGDALPMVRAIYEKSGALSDAEFGRQFFGDALFTGAAQALAGFVVKSGGIAHVYHFAYIADPLRGKDPGVGHGGEIAYVFGLRKLGFIADLATDKDRGVVALTQAYWTNFAKTGDPNGAGLPAWPSFSQENQQTLVVDDQTKAVADFRRGQAGIMQAGWRKRVGASAP